MVSFHLPNPSALLLPLMLHRRRLNSLGKDLEFILRLSDPSGPVVTDAFSLVLSYWGLWPDLL